MEHKFQIVVCDLSERWAEKAAERAADIRAMREGRVTAKEVHDRNTAFRGNKDWAHVDWSQACSQSSEEDEVIGGTILD